MKYLLILSLLIISCKDKKVMPEVKQEIAADSSLPKKAGLTAPVYTSAKGYTWVSTGVVGSATMQTYSLNGPVDYDPFKGLDGQKETATLSIYDYIITSGDDTIAYRKHGKPAIIYNAPEAIDMIIRDYKRMEKNRERVQLYDHDGVMTIQIFPKY